MQHLPLSHTTLNALSLSHYLVPSLSLQAAERLLREDEHAGEQPYGVRSPGLEPRKSGG